MRPVIFMPWWLLILLFPFVVGYYLLMATVFVVTGGAIALGYGGVGANHGWRNWEWRKRTSGRKLLLYMLPLVAIALFARISDNAFAIAMWSAIAVLIARRVIRQRKERRGS